MTEMKRTQTLQHGHRALKGQVYSV